MSGIRCQSILRLSAGRASVQSLLLDARDGERATHRIRAASSGVKSTFLPAVRPAATSTSLEPTVGLSALWKEPSASSFLSMDAVELDAMVVACVCACRVGGCLGVFSGVAARERASGGVRRGGGGDGGRDAAGGAARRGIYTCKRSSISDS